MANEKAELHLTGLRVGGPSFEDIIALFRSLTGREPMPEDLAKAKAAYDRDHGPTKS